MNYSIIIDSVASLPEYILKSRPIKILPVTITIDGKEQPDTYSESELRKIYKNKKINSDSDINTIPPNSEEISEFIMREIVPHHHYAICQTTSAEHSPIYGAFTDSAHHIAKKSRDLRDSLGITHPFYMSYINSATSNAGQGLIAMYGDIMLSRGVDHQKYKENVEKFKAATKTFTIVKDILYTRNRAKSLGIESVGLPTAMIGQAIGVSPIIRFTRDKMEPIILKPGFGKAVDRVCDYLIDRIGEGLFLPMINISYAGDLKDLKQFKSFRKLQKVAEKKKIKLLVGMMSLCGCINYSPGSFSAGIAPKNQKADP